MGRLRLCCCAIILMSLGLIVELYVSGTSVIAPVALAIGTVLLAAVAPFPAYDRPARKRVLAACLAYTAAAAVASAIALATGSSSYDALTIGLPVMGAVLAL